MSRIFIALKPNKELSNYLSKLKLGLKKNLLADENITWYVLENHHITLNFIGEVEPEQLVELKDNIRATIQRPEVQVTVENISYFPNTSGQIITANIKKTPVLLDMHQKISEVVSNIGLGHSPIDYNPHITLGRFKEKTRGQYEFPDLKPLMKTTLFSIEIYESIFEEGKSRYRLLHSF